MPLSPSLVLLFDFFSRPSSRSGICAPSSSTCTLPEMCGPCRCHTMALARPRPSPHPRRAHSPPLAPLSPRARHTLPPLPYSLARRRHCSFGLPVVYACALLISRHHKRPPPLLLASQQPRPGCMMEEDSELLQVSRTILMAMSLSLSTKLNQFRGMFEASSISPSPRLSSSASSPRQPPPAPS